MRTEDQEDFTSPRIPFNSQSSINTFGAANRWAPEGMGYGGSS